MSALPQVRMFTFDEYLRIERDAPYKSKYVDGMIYAMSGGKGNHSFIAVNTSTALSNRLRERQCWIGNSDLMVATTDRTFSAYPDVTVVCGSPTYLDDSQDVLINPVLIVEVLSPSTEHYDRGEKFERYQQIASLNGYLLISQDKPLVEFWRREGEAWVSSTMTGLDLSLSISFLEINVPLSEVYKGIFNV